VFNSKPSLSFGYSYHIGLIIGVPSVDAT